MVRERNELAQREQIASQLASELKTVAEATNNNADTELIQVLRDPRVIAERFERLQLEAERQMEVFCKPPVFIREGNPAQDKAMRRGVRVRALYERACVDIEIVQSNLAKWIAGGEEARIYDGELPHKLAIFDRQNILMPLVPPGGQGRTLFVRNPQLAASLGMLFDYIWKESEPIPPAAPKKPARSENAKSNKENSGDRERRTGERATASVAPGQPEKTAQRRNGEQPASEPHSSNNHRRRSGMTGKTETA